MYARLNQKTFNKKLKWKHTGKVAQITIGTAKVDIVAQSSQWLLLFWKEDCYLFWWNDRESIKTFLNACTSLNADVMETWNLH